MKTIYLHLKTRSTPQGETYVATCWGDDPRDAVTREGLLLGPDDQVAIPDPAAAHTRREYSLGELARMLVEFDRGTLEAVFDERGQVTIGRHLFDQTFGRLERCRFESDVDLRIVTDDEHLAGLLWPLLTRGDGFLVAEGWTVSLLTRANGAGAVRPDLIQSHVQELPDLELPTVPKTLLVGPEPVGVSPTKRDLHLNQLELLLRTYHPRAADTKHCREVRSWQDFCGAVGSGQFDIVYYYGHGVGTQNRSRLVFEEETGRPIEIPVGDFADVLRQAPTRPLLAYLNCCLGDAGGLLGAGRQVGAVVPCVVTNRTVATVRAAAAQAVAFWRSVLFRGLDPRLAVARNYAQLGPVELGRDSPHWFTPVLHANYGRWSFRPARSVGPEQYDPHWKLKVDRTQQFGDLSYKVRDMVREKRPRALAFLWYGEPGQGMTYFQERLEVELAENVDAAVVPYRPRWPDRYAAEGTRRFSPRAFEEMLWEAFDVTSLDQIGARVRRDAASHDAVVVVLNHQHVTSLRRMHPELIKDYLRFWNDTVSPQLDDELHHFVLTYSFQATNPARFARGLTRRGYDTLIYPHVALDILPCLGTITPSDLVKFFQRHNIAVPEDRKQRFLEYLMERTGGQYEATLDELEKLVVDGYTEIFDDRPEETAPDADDWGMEEGSGDG